MRFFSQVLATVAIVATGVAAELEDGVQLGEIFGGPHGKKYSDIELVSAGQAVRSITIRSSDRVDAVALDVDTIQGDPTTFYHGGNGGDKNTLTMGGDEHVTGIEVHWGKYYRKTRVMYIEFTTNAGNTLSGGTPQKNTDKIDSDTAPEGYQLGGFQGFAGNELDSVGAIWTSIEPVEEEGSF
ncbi:hypothetical protein P3T76_006988 [Phytophthora citrophthora]|uniref:Jacalin-type lectin domain-containing protein n=1 Tax=Phytophthora citrophthora TaxID=4793 RepID=A0AAD9GN71_9STRA|nr:hypothetical protein P3T76_006988 [Phytophthora citrophthora]